MHKDLLEQSIKDIEESIKTSKENFKKAQQHIEEGEVILKALQDEFSKL